ncbi:hypothetical protein JKY79_00455, partial [Candidatus Babeliales bacterium]|nr:hypothetical protein [Candidatus Babeliales bacterium]
MMGLTKTSILLWSVFSTNIILYGAQQGGLAPLDDPFSNTSTFEEDAFAGIPSQGNSLI